MARPTFPEVISDAVEALGVKHVGVIMGIAQVDWQSRDELRDFLTQVAGGR